MLTIALSISLVALHLALTANFALQLLAGALQVESRRERLHRSTDREGVRADARQAGGLSREQADELISIHVPIHAEPPEVVSETLEALSRLDDIAFEVIVLDNNTVEEKLWRPIQAVCRRLGPRFHFAHVDDLDGAKAGALNVTRRMTSSRARWIAVVDADYQITRDFLCQCRQAFRETSADYVQFPQAYREADNRQQPIVMELSDYFESQAAWAERHRTMLLTGTLSCIAVEALDAVGGWPTDTITEDADLGTRLLQGGYTGHFVDCTAGRGLLPPSLSELSRQRHRWIMGNLHVLKSLVRQRSSILWQTGVVGQLTAWCSFTTLPLLVLVFEHAQALVSHGSFFGAPVLLMASVSVLLQFLIATMASASSSPGVPRRTRYAMLAIRWGMTTASGVSTLMGLLSVSRTFRCTRRGQSAWEAEHHIGWILALGLLFCVWANALEVPWFVSFATVLMAGSLLLQYEIDRSLRRTELRLPSYPPRQRRSSTDP